VYNFEDILVQTELHPTHNKINVICTCGNKFNITTTHNVKEMHVELCFKCHSAYTGKRKIAQAGAIEKFQKKFGAYTKAQTANTEK
jgi:large subunit ribosomal protein L31